ncbi:hypothetical protein AAC387_Pa04g1203 [Persea americana]
MTDDHNPQSGSRSIKAGWSGSLSKRRPMISMQETLNIDEQEGSSRRNKAGKMHYSTAMNFFFYEDQAERASMIFDVNFVSPLACLPSTEVNDLHVTHLGTQELYQNLQEGWISVVKICGKRKSKVNCTSIPSSSNPPVTAKQVAMTVNEIKKEVAIHPNLVSLIQVNG